jgi:microcystin-dependent protein
MGGTAASRLTLARSQGSYGNLGASGGAESHTIIEAELAAHIHSLRIGNVSPGDGSGARYSNNDTGNGVVQINTTGSSTAHNNTQPTITANIMIKT